MSTQSTTRSKANILIVDDVPDNIRFLEGLLKGRYGIKAATNGLAALKVAKKIHPDLILLDVVMPEMDGYAVCEKLKEDPETEDIPVIFVTGNTQVEQVTRGFDVGGIDYIVKPYNPRELLARVSTHLEAKKTRERLAVLASKLGKYLSPDVYRSIFTGEKDVVIGASRKFLTVFFSDIVNFSGTAENMNSFELVDWLNGYLNAMAKIANVYNGTLDKFIGDAIMVFFGDPQSHGKQDDAIQCVRMAKHMVATAEEMGFKIRVGVNSGECVVGNFGSEERMNYSIIGNEVNVSSRLENNSEPNRILVSQTTYDLIKDEFSCTHRGEIHVKNMKKPIDVYWVD
ncbi:MAG: adenylate/guanylate cyclase domain-containing protein [Spirochaetales bacterium]|nr:adenylate/guanylate cyclase domain-containing protein [Spirochaetales bacterium]